MRLIATLLLASLAATAQAGLSPFTATYDVRRNGDLLGEATMTLARGPDGTWQFSTMTRGTAGLAKIAGVRIEERSRLRELNGALETVSYHYSQRTGFNHRERSVQVAPAQQRIVMRDRDREVTAPYVGGVLDRQGVTLALMQATATPAATDWRFPVADRGKVDEHRWRRSAAVRLRTALGTERAIRLERVRDSADGKRTLLWLDRETGLPLKIRQDDDDESIEMRIRSRG
jgi:hypothetical protein